MSSPGDLNGVPVSAPEAPQDGLRERGSFIVFGRALGPSPFTDPGFAHHANSEFVDLSREYEYPLQYRNLKGLGLISAVGFGCLYIAGDANMLKQPETVLLVVVGFLALLFAGCFFCCVNCLHFLCAPASPPQLLSRTELRHLLGTTACTFWTILLLVAGGLKHFITAQPGERWLEEALFIIESFGAIVTNVMATAGAIPGWYHGTTPKVVDRIHAALNASRTEKFWCAKDLRESYVCGPAVVEWWPGAWTSWLLGTGIIVLFCLLACIGLPVVERDFHSRQQQAAAEAANPRGQVVQMA